MNIVILFLIVFFEIVLFVCALCLISHLISIREVLKEGFKEEKELLSEIEKSTKETEELKRRSNKAYHI